MLMQESAYKISAKNMQCGSKCEIADYGIGQINKSTVIRFKFDKTRLLSDMVYSIEASAIVLSDFKRMYGKNDSEYWTRYNASNPIKRDTYKRLVARYL